MGPGAGLSGGEIIAQGTPKEIEKNPKSLTGKYLSGKLKIDIPSKHRKPDGYINIFGAEENNLKDIDISIPTGVLTLITGVSGSGKSTLINEILYKAMAKDVYGSRLEVGKHKRIEYDTKVDKIIKINQSPIGKTPRSNPATYTKLFDEIRAIFAQLPESRIKGYKPGRFSFNVKGGRCNACEGDGLIKIEMNFLPDVYVECEECRGKRYNNETLEIKYKGKSIADVLSLSVDEAYALFENIPSIRIKLETLKRVGLGYIKLGQSATTLSGGEAQRIKLTRELAKRSTGNTLYLLDEPTTGLHFHDTKRLISVINDLVDKKNTVIIIEHNLDVIKSADHIIDLGPEGGDFGGQIICQGTPSEVADCPNSYTGQFLKKILDKVQDGKKYSA
jgi:excinuclease ABC subunit A